MPWRFVAGVVDVLTFGAKKYSPDNWRKVPDWKARYTAALFRHVVAWLQGERLDPETKLHHLYHAGCCLAFLAELDQQTGLTLRQRVEAYCESVGIEVVQFYRNGPYGVSILWKRLLADRYWSCSYNVGSQVVEALDPDAYVRLDDALYNGLVLELGEQAQVKSSGLQSSELQTTPIGAEPKGQ